MLVGLHVKAAGAARDQGNLAGVRLAGKLFASFLRGGLDHTLIIELRAGVNLGFKVGLQAETARDRAMRPASASTTSHT